MSFISIKNNRVDEKNLKNIEQTASYTIGKVYLWGAFGALAITILPYLILAFFSVPSADDFYQATNAVDKGVISYVNWRYTSWNGRYAADLLIALYQLIGHQISEAFLTKYYYVSSILFIFIHWLASYSLICILHQKNNIRIGLIYSSVSIISILSNTEVRSTFFWLSGGIAYSLGNALVLLLFPLCIYLFYYNYRRDLLLLCALLVFSINGLSETVMVACTIFILCLLIFEIVLPKVTTLEVNYTILTGKATLAGVAAISAYMMCAAPGNAVRSSVNSYSQSIFKVVQYSLMHSFFKAFEWVNPFWLSQIVIIVLISYAFQEDKKVTAFFQDWRKFFPVLLSLLFSFYMTYFVRIYAIGGIRPIRADSTSYTMFFALTSLVGLFIRFNILNRLSWNKYLPSQTYSQLLLFSIVLFSCFSSISNYSYYSLVHDFQLLSSHRKYYQDSYLALAIAEDNSSVELSPEPRAEILRWKCYLTDDKDYWVNKAVADYFDLSGVTVEGVREPDPEFPGTGECGE